MARYTAEKKATEFSELGNSILLAMLIISNTPAKNPPHPTVGQGDKLWIPGRAICKFIGGKWTSYRHKEAMKLVETKCLEAWKGYDRGSNKKELWRYSLTEQATVYFADLSAHSAKDSLRITPSQPQLFEVNHAK